MLKSRTSFPPLGFQFYEARTGWTSSPHIGFDPTALEMQQHRLANKGLPNTDWVTDLDSIRAELDAYTTARLLSQYGDGASEWITGGPPPTFFTPRHQPRQRVVAREVAAVSKVVAGIGLLVDFLGPKLKPVERGLAEQRASICLTCPKNQPGTAFEQAGGKALHLLLEYKADQKLETIHDDKLLYCMACGCNLRLKPHVDLEYTLSKTTPEQMAAFDKRCWILSRDGTVST